MPKVLKDLFDLTDRVALVTGGSGGLGSEVALAFSDYGAKVTIAARQREPLERTATQITEKTGNEVQSVQCDVTQEGPVQDMVADVVRRQGRIDILANFSGANIRKPADEYPLADWESMFRANVTSVFLCCREAGKQMIKQKKGKIINVSSIRSEFGVAKHGLAYCATKAAVNMITRQLACEWAPYNVLVNAIAPPIVETPLTKEFFRDQKFADTIRARIPLGRWGYPEDITGCALFLASNASNFMTGEIVFVDGGMTAW